MRARWRRLLTRIGDAGGRYQCDDCGLHSVGWYWRCPKCRSWDSMRPAVFKWAERADGRRAAVIETDGRGADLAHVSRTLGALATRSAPERL